MKRMYTIIDRPDQWLLFKISRKELEDGEEFEFTDDLEDGPIYKVAGTWHGGYLDGDAWRFNSGVKSVEYDDDDNDILFHGFSGSIYAGKSYNYGANSYTLSVIEYYSKKWAKSGHVTEILSEEEAMEYIKTMLESEEESS